MINDILRGLFEHVPDICLFHRCFSPANKQNFRALSLQTTLLEYQVNRISTLSQDGLKEFCCMYFVTSHFISQLPPNFLLKIPLFNNLKEIMIIWYSKEYYSVVSLDHKYIYMNNAPLFLQVKNESNISGRTYKITSHFLCTTKSNVHNVNVFPFII
jgi:hypothetical protein